MANNLIQVKRTSISGRAANSTTLPNPGELALNMTDGILYSTNGATVFEIGANNTNARITGTLTVNAVSANGGVGTNNQVLTSNGSRAYWKEQIIKDLADVAANGATDTQVLTYNSTLSKWVNQNPPVANVVYTTGYYGSFYDLSDQYATGGSNTATVTRLANTFLSNGLTRTANDELQVAYAGVYQISYSLQFTSSSNKNETVWVWLRKNGTDVPESGTDFGVYPVSGASNGFIVTVTSLIDNANAGDKFQIMWATSANSSVTMVYVANTAFAPEVPSAIVNITPISNIITAPPGTNTDVTFNDSGLANGAAGLTYNKTTNSVSVANNLFVGNTVNSTTFQVGSSFTANSTLVNAAALLVRGGATVNNTLTVNAISANGGVGTTGQVLFTDGTKAYWNTAAFGGSVNVNAQYVWTNTHTFQNTVTFGNSTVNSTVNSTFFTGTSNNTSFVGSVSAANVVSNSQLSGNLSNYQTTAGLSANVATLTSNNATHAFGKTEGNLNVNNALTSNGSSYLGGVAAAAYVQNTDSRTLSGNLVFTGANTTVSAEFRVVNSTANVLYAAANGNLGVGINTPGAKLHVNGDVITGKLQHSPVPISKLLTGFDAADSDFFGISLSLSSDSSVLAVGAWNWEGATGTNRGGVYIYDWNGSSWVQRGSVLEAVDAADSDVFGGAVSLSSNGSILAVGAFNWEGATGTNRGGVYIYDWNGSSWVQRGSVLEAVDAADGDGFGISASLSSNGSILAVGASGWVGATGTDRGGVYIYDWNGSAWVQRGSVIEAADAADGDEFGTAVSLSSNGSILAVGAYNWEGATGTNRGGVYIYDWNGSSWIQRGSVLEAADAADSDNLGYLSGVSLSSSGSILAVGSIGWEGATGTNRGGVYIYDWNGSNWIQRGSVLEAVDAADSDRFGAVSLSSDGSVLVAGAYRWEGTTGTDRGSVYTYSLTGALPSYSGVATGSGWIEGANSALIGRTAGLNRITVDISGNVGIGNTAPDATLAVTGTANVSGNSRFGGVATFAANVILGSSAVSANGGFGTAGQILHSNGTATYWDTDDQGVTSVASGDGLTGGPITANGTLSVLANTGIVANTSGLFVNAAYINTIGAAELGGFVAAAYVKNTDTRILSGNLNFTGANNYFTVQVGVNNAVINSSGVYAPSLYGNLTGNVAATNITGNLTGNVAATTITGNLTGNVVAGTVNATTINATSSIVVGANVSLNTSVLSIGNSTVNVFVNSTAHVGNVVATTVTGNLTGNVVATTISGNLTGNVSATTLSGNLTAITANVTNKLQIGIPGSFDFGSNAVIEIDANGNTYVQTVIQNSNTGNNASADLVVTNDTGNDSVDYVDLGINGSQYNQAGYSIAGAGDAYLYSSNGHLTIGTRSAKEVIFHANGTTASDRKFTINATAVTIANNTALVANGSTGTAGHVLHSSNTGVYWAADDGGITSITSGNGITGGTITTTGTLSVTQGTGVVVNTSGVHVNATYINTISANSATYLGAAGNFGNASGIYTSGLVNAATVNATTLQTGAGFSANGTQVTAADLLVTGNLIVNGTTVTLNTATLDVKDLNITLAKGTASAAAANGAGITVDGAAATLTYINAGNTWLSNINFTVGNTGSNVSVNSTAFIGNVVATRVTANLTGNVTATTISGNLTGNVAAVTITGNLTGNVVATTVNATTINATANIVVGANVLVNTSVLLIGNSTANVYVNSTAFVGNVVATTVSGNLSGTAANATLLNNKTEGNLNVNSALYANASVTNAFTIGTASYFVANGNLGVGTSTPATKLTVNPKVSDDNSANYDSNTVYFTHQSPTGTAILNDPKPVLLLARQGTSGQAYGAAAEFNLSRYENASINSRTRLDIRLADGSFLTNNTTVLTALSNGNIGIGNTAPAFKLRVDGTTSLAGAVSGITTLAAGNTTITGFANVTTTIQGGSSLTIAGALSGVTTAAMGNTTITGFVNATSTLAAGNTTITGFVNATSTLAAGNTTITGSLVATRSITITNGGGTYQAGSIYADANWGMLYRSAQTTPASAQFAWKSSDDATEYMRISPTGNVGIGNTSPAHKLRVTGTSSLAGAVSDITTLAAGNTTITGFINATSTLAAGNTTITGFSNVSGNGQFSGNVGIGIAPDSTVGLFVVKAHSATATTWGIVSSTSDANAALTAAQIKYGAGSLLYNNSQNKSGDGLTSYNSSYLGYNSVVYNGLGGVDARANLMEGVRGNVQQHSNGASSNSISVARGVYGVVQNYGSGIISTAYGIVGDIQGVNNSITGNITTAFAAYTQIVSNTAMTIGTGYLYYGAHFGATTTTKYGMYLTGEQYNYFSGNVGIGNTTPAFKLRVDGTTSLAGAVSDITTLAAGNTTVTGFVNATSSVNAASLTVGTSTIANTTGVYTGIVNAATHSVGTAFTANATVVNAVSYYSGTLLVANTTVINATHLAGFTLAAPSILGSGTANGASLTYANVSGQVNTATLYVTTSANIASAVQANASGVYTTGTVNALSYTVGTAFTANSTVVNAVSYNVGTRIVANSTVVNATHLEGVAASSYYRSGSTDVALADGGTNASLTASAGAIAFSNTTSLALTAVGTSGHLLTSAGAGTPTWASTLTPNLTLSGNTIFSGSNTTVNAEFRVINSTANVFFVAANGNVGIGNNTPTAPFVVERSANSSTAYTVRNSNTGTGSQVVMQLQSGSASGLNMTVTESGAYYVIAPFGAAGTAGYLDANTHVFRTVAGGEKVRIDVSGNVGIGNTAPAHKLRVTGTTSLAGAVSDITTLATGNVTVTGFANVTSTIQGGSSLAIAGALSGVTTAAMGNTTITGFANVVGSSQITSLGIGTAASGTTGEIRATNNITAYFSDKRLKKDIRVIEDALEKINKISGVTFQSNEEAEKYGYTDKRVQVGVIAQEIEAVLPQVVVPAPFDIDVDEDGNEYSKSGENYKTVQYEKIVPLLIEAIKELKAEIDALKTNKEI